ncbi:MAG: radical SAM protein [Candidatus Methylarchaceae archaeon HK01B]|nr:radical SAM protein [Candidatus Methylarchaceae archaeon HK01M]MCP8312648.1 radical SAM protein [Candidatus Methylarchaceae archaeon HK02M1]MCP8318906.1 radical SAM protein [Candidatus Methylarchaceae archaeon HK01B]
MLLKSALRNVLKGSNRTAVFAVTTRCNCKCIMCDMHRKRPESISSEDAYKIIDFLAQSRFLVLYLTGGEPTLHPDVVKILEYSGQKGLITSMTTNGTLSHNLLSALKEAGLFLLSVSLDHWDAKICEGIRRHNHIRQKQIDTIKYAKKIGLRTHALSFLNPFLLRDGVGNMIRYVNEELGVPFSFCYPTACDVNSYRLGGEISKEELSRNLRRGIATILSMKRRGYEILNSGTYIEDILNFLENKTPNFYCRGGQDVFYIDWMGDVYPCFSKPKLFNVLEEKPHFLENVACNECLTNCFREPSLFPQLFSPSLLVKEFLLHPPKLIFV